MKGIAIHVEQLIIIILAVLILLALITFFLGVWSPTTIIYMAHKNRACAVLQNNGCSTKIATVELGYDSGVDKSEIGTGSGPATVRDVCRKVLGDPSDLDTACLKSCACMH